MHLWSPQPQHQHESWLSLIAETAGVAGCGIARIEVTVPEALALRERIVVQVRDGRGAVLGAAEFSGYASETLGLDAGESISLDVGYSSLAPEPPLSVLVWIEREDEFSDPNALEAPPNAVAAPLESRVRVVLESRGRVRFAA